MLSHGRFERLLGKLEMHIDNVSSQICLCMSVLP